MSELPEDDFLEHPDEFTEDDLDLDEEVQLLRPLFPEGDKSRESEWKALFK